jgi:hypothetical protein
VYLVGQGLGYAGNETGIHHVVLSGARQTPS